MKKTLLFFVCLFSMTSLWGMANRVSRPEGSVDQRKCEVVWNSSLLDLSPTFIEYDANDKVLVMHPFYNLQKGQNLRFLLNASTAYIKVSVRLIDNLKDNKSLLMWFPVIFSVEESGITKITIDDTLLPGQNEPMPFEQ